MPSPRPINPEEKEYAESMNVLGKIVRIYDDKICVEEFCKDGNTLPVHVKGNVGLDAKNSIKLQIIFCDRNYLLDCVDDQSHKNLILGEISTKNNDGGNFYAEWTIRKTAMTGLHQIKGIVDGKVVGEVGDTMMETVNGVTNRQIIILNNIERSKVNSDMMDNNLMGKTGKQMSPHAQMRHGIASENVMCNEGLHLIHKMRDGMPACVFPTSVEKFIQRGWIK